MAMTGSGLKALLKPRIETEIRNSYTIVAGFGDAELAKFCEALATAIANEVVDYIKANAQIVGTASGVQGGPNTAPVTGTVT